MIKQYKIKYFLLPVLLFVASNSIGQKHSKTFNETFKVVDSAILDINTSYADIEFDTWNKNEVFIEAVVVVEGATEEEATAFFKDEPIAIFGNSKTISINSNNAVSTLFNAVDFREDNSSFNLPNSYEIEDIIVAIPEIEIPELPEMPPLPPVPNFKFDYNAYKQEGDVYLQRWQKEVDASFDKDYQDKIEAWKKKVEAKMEKAAEKVQLAQEKRERAHVQMEKAHKKVEEAHKAVEENKKNTFYKSNGGKPRNFIIKKKIKIKLPKSTKMNLNIRHGEVKLAQQTFNLKATLLHSNLLGNIIEGNNTMVNASYSPVTIQKWNYGSLKADYADYVDLGEVLFLNLNATSSNVTIHKLLKKVVINNSFGPLNIKYVDSNFKNINIVMDNAELECNLPDSACNISGNLYASEFSYPKNLQIRKDCSSNTTIVKGYSINNNAKNNISINTKFSEVVLK